MLRHEICVLLRRTTSSSLINTLDRMLDYRVNAVKYFIHIYQILIVAYQISGALSSTGFVVAKSAS